MSPIQQEAERLERELSERLLRFSKPIDRQPANLVHGYGAYFQNLREGETALSFNEWIEAVS
ncbi:MAG: hypothetical protein [Caudoviricetes sp.]|nr:MAG: hypothetical protein [Caudoviricetes sp.]